MKVESDSILAGVFAYAAHLFGIKTFAVQTAYRALNLKSSIDTEIRLESLRAISHSSSSTVNVALPLAIGI